MSQLDRNAERMVQLFAWMRTDRLGPGFMQLKALNLSISHMRALQLLGHGALSMKELAEQMQMAPPSVTALTRRLSQTELVQRMNHTEDSRVVLISLTEKGRSLQEQVFREHVDRMADLLRGLSEAEQQQFLDLLERAVRALQVREPADGFREFGTSPAAQSDAATATTADD